MDWRYLFLSLLHKGDIVLDIGAHQGGIASFCSKIVGPSGKVVAFEPRGDHLKILRGKRLGNVTCEAKAVSSTSGTVMFYFSMEPHASGASTIVPELANDIRLGKKIKTELVESTSVDDYCALHSLTPSLIKIDVEGAEDKVLAGAETTLRTYRPAIYFEQGVVADSIPGTVGFLRNLGYEVAICDFFRFINLNSRMWEYGNYSTSECEALRTKLITFDDPELIEYRPLHTNMVAIHPSGTGAKVDFGKPVRLRDGVLLAAFPSPPKKGIADYAKIIIKKLLSDSMLQVLRRIRDRMQQPR